MKPTKRDYTVMTIMCFELGLVPYKNRIGLIEEGKYTLNGLHAPIDLSACQELDGAILRTALRQLSERVDEAHQNNIERDLQS